MSTTRLNYNATGAPLRHGGVNILTQYIYICNKKSRSKGVDEPECPVLPGNEDTPPFPLSLGVRMKNAQGTTHFFKGNGFSPLLTFLYSIHNFSRTLKKIKKRPPVIKTTAVYFHKFRQESFLRARQFLIKLFWSLEY